MRQNDLQQVNGIISRAFTQGRIDDGYAYTKVPMCQPGFIEMYYAQGPQGCFVVEETGQIRGAAFCHLWGRTGWIGPLAIVPEKHHLGIGKKLASHAAQYLKSVGCTTIGLETNPRSNRNLGFYGKIGFVPSLLSIDMIRPVSALAVEENVSPHSIIFYSRLSNAEKEEFHLHVWSLTQAAAPGVDYTNLIKLYDKYRQGETLLFMRKNTPIAVAILQTKPSLVDEQNALMRIVVFIAHAKTPDVYFPYFLADFLIFARDNKLDRILVRVPMYSHRAFKMLLNNNYRVANSDLRMTLEGYPEKNNPKVIHLNRWV